MISPYFWTLVFYRRFINRQGRMDGRVGFRSFILSMAESAKNVECNSFTRFYVKPFFLTLKIRFTTESETDASSLGIKSLCWYKRLLEKTARRNLVMLFRHETLQEPDSCQFQNERINRVFGYLWCFIKSSLQGQNRKRIWHRFERRMRGKREREMLSAPKAAVLSPAMQNSL